MKTSTPPERPEHVPNLIVRGARKFAEGWDPPAQDNFATFAGRLQFERMLTAVFSHAADRSGLKAD